MGAWGRLRDWGTLDKLGTVADLLFKIAALVAALAAANFFYYQPEVKLTTNAQAFIDLEALGAAYSAAREPLPSTVRRVAVEYNEANTLDLLRGGNSTLGKLPPLELCARIPRVVRTVFPEADCRSMQVTFGRGRYFERLLLSLNADRRRPLRVEQLRTALSRLQNAEFRRARCAIENVGNAKAVNVQIRPSDGFVRPRGEVNDPFALEPNPGAPVHRTFESSPGGLTRDPELEFGVDWTRGGLTDTGPATIVATVLLLAFVLVLINDFVRSERTRREERDADGEDDTGDG